MECYSPIDGATYISQNLFHSFESRPQNNISRLFFKCLWEFYYLAIDGDTAGYLYLNYGTSIHSILFIRLSIQCCHFIAFSAKSSVFLYIQPVFENFSAQPRLFCIVLSFNTTTQFLCFVEARYGKRTSIQGKKNISICSFYHDIRGNPQNTNSYDPCQLNNMPG